MQANDVAPPFRTCSVCCLNQEKGIDCEALASMFRLSTRSQSKPAVWDALTKWGFTHPLRRSLSDVHRAELFEHVVTSLALRLTRHEDCHPGILNGRGDAHVEEGSSSDLGQAGEEIREQSARDLKSVPRETQDFFKLCTDVCSIEETDYFGGRAGNTNLEELVASAEIMLPRFISLVGSSFEPAAMTRKILAPGLGRIEAANPSLSNKSRVTPGGDPATGNPIPIFVSISGTAVPIDRRVLREYVSDMM